MAKKDDNFDFDTEGKGKLSLDLSFFTNLTKQQKGIILIAAVAVVLVIAIVVTCIILGAGNTNNGTGNSGNTNGGTNGGITSDGNNDSDIPEEITVMDIAALPNKLTYYVGDDPNYAGLSVYIKSEDLPSSHIKYEDHPEDFIITGFDSSEPNDELVITVECRGLTDTFTVKILPAPVVGVTLTGITMKVLPKTNYVLGEAFDPTDGVILAEYSDGTTVEVNLQINNVSGFSYITTAGEHQIKIKFFDDNGGYAETYITITVTE